MRPSCFIVLAHICLSILSNELYYKRVYSTIHRFYDVLYSISQMYIYWILPDYLAFRINVQYLIYVVKDNALNTSRNSLFVLMKQYEMRNDCLLSS